jgi:predicted nucleic acid-binding Zn ribbon protein
LNDQKVISPEEYSKMTRQEIADIPELPKFKGFHNPYKRCPVCNKMFKSKQWNEITCSDKCKAIRKRLYNTNYIRKKRHPNTKVCEPCIICGYKLTTDTHHESGKTYKLCPNHHALISRGIKTLDELMMDKAHGKLNLR